MKERHGRKLSDNDIGVLLGLGEGKHPLVHVARNRFRDDFALSEADYENMETCVDKAIEAYNGQVVSNP